MASVRLGLMRYVGEALVRDANDADQEFYASVDEFARAKGYSHLVGRAWMHTDRERSMVEYANRRVTAVVETRIEAIGTRKLRGPFAQEVLDGDFISLLTTADDGSEYYIVGTQVWQASEFEASADYEELDLLVRAAARRRDLDRDRRLMDARRVLGEGDGGTTTRRTIPNDVKMFVWQRDGGTCVQCGTNADLEFDHIIPLSMGGADTARNLQLLCGSCNRAKGGRLV